MRYAHVIVDGFSLLHRDLTLRRLLARKPALARHQLVLRAAALAQMLGDRVTVVFDGRAGINDAFVGMPCEVVFTRMGQTADAFIERLIHKGREPQRMLVVTSDRLERQTVEAAGAHTMSSGDFLSAERDAKRAATPPGRTNGKSRPNRVGDYFPSGPDSRT